MITVKKDKIWKKQFRKKRGCEFSTVTSGTERKRGFVGMLRSCANHSPIFSNSNKPLNTEIKAFVGIAFQPDIISREQAETIAQTLQMELLNIA
mgnify:CR=1 FL=1